MISAAPVASQWKTPCRSAAWLVAMASAGCQVVEGIFKAGMWVGILLVVVVLGIVFMVFGRSST